jgi:GTP cyclohydrolase-4
MTSKLPAHSVLLGIGANVGGRRANMERALAWLTEVHGIRVVKLSRAIETEPVGGPPQGLFLNAAAEIETEKTPGDLLTALKEAEVQLGRTSTVRNGPRPIDLDILLYDDLILEEAGLRIPHEAMLERAFVLEPLAEIAPGRVHPHSGRTVAEHWLELKRTGVRRGEG